MSDKSKSPPKVYWKSSTKDIENIDIKDILKDQSPTHIKKQNVEENKISDGSVPTGGLRSSSARKLMPSGSGKITIRDRSGSAKRILASSKPPKASPMKIVGTDAKSEMSKNEML